jgi:hypothetical protein
MAETRPRAAAPAAMARRASSREAMQQILTRGVGICDSPNGMSDHISGLVPGIKWREQHLGFRFAERAVL